jgi:hypothetical protein
MTGSVEEQVAECAICGEPVHPCDPRELTDAGLAHIDCTGKELPPDPPQEGYEDAKHKEERKLEALRADVARRLAQREEGR